MSDNIKRRVGDISMASIIAMIPLLVVGWTVAKPALILSISTALASDFDEKMDKKIDKQSKPIANAFKVILKVDIDRKKKVIAELEFKEQHKPDLWTVEDAKLMAQCKIELQSITEAYSEL